MACFEPRFNAEVKFQAFRVSADGRDGVAILARITAEIDR